MSKSDRRRDRKAKEQDRRRRWESGMRKFAQSVLRPREALEQLYRQAKESHRSILDVIEFKLPNEPPLDEVLGGLGLTGYTQVFYDTAGGTEGYGSEGGTHGGSTTIVRGPDGRCCRCSGSRPRSTGTGR